MSGDESFLSRWARLKRASAEPAEALPAAPEPTGTLPAQPLPPLESLDFASDFRAFLHEKVEESVKRAALKKLFHSPEFNVMDGLDVYIDDYGAPDPIPPEMLRQLAHANEMLFGTAPERGEAATNAGQDTTDADEPTAAAQSADQEPTGPANATGPG